MANDFGIGQMVERELQAMATRPAQPRAVPKSEPTNGSIIDRLVAESLPETKRFAAAHADMVARQIKGNAVNRKSEKQRFQELADKLNPNF